MNADPQETTRGIAANVARVQEIINAACARAGRNPAEVTLVAISKQRTAQEVLAAVAAGVQHFGENRVEEAGDKIPEVQAAVSYTTLTWHMVGHIQSRKARDVPPLFDVVHSVDSIKLAERLSRTVAESAEVRNNPLDVLLQVNVSGEETKSGFDAVGWQANRAVRDQLQADVRHVMRLPGLRVRGLMTMAPIAEDAEQVRPVFAELAALRVALMESLNVDLPELSMGMTDDYPVAVEEGATMVRIGRAIFGERQY